MAGENVKHNRGHAVSEITFVYESNEAALFKY